MAVTSPLFWKIAVEDAVDLHSWVVPGMVSIDALHVTLLYLGGKTAAEAARANDLSAEASQQIYEALEAMSDCEVPITVTRVLKHHEMVVAQVTLPDDVPCASPVPHLTLCRSPAVRPVFAKDLLRDPQSCTVIELSPPLRLRGHVRLETACAHSGGPQRDLGGPTVFEAKFLKVETKGRSSRQEEPRGFATFINLREGDAKKWAAKLAASVKERPAGPPLCKLKVRMQQDGQPGHLYLKWGASAGGMDAREISAILEQRLQELM